MMKAKPYPFLFDELENFDYYTKPMFGCLAIYSNSKILLILRDRKDHPFDNGIWIATTAEHHASLRKDFPNLRSIRLFDSEGETSWQNLPVSSDDFEESVIKICALVKKADPRIGKTPKPKKRKTAERKKSSRRKKGIGKN